MKDNKEAKKTEKRGGESEMDYSTPGKPKKGKQETSSVVIESKRSPRKMLTPRKGAKGEQLITAGNFDVMPDEVILNAFYFLEDRDVGSLLASSKGVKKSFENDIWWTFIQRDFNYEIPEEGVPHLLDPRTIYCHLKAHSKIRKEEVNLFLDMDPAIFKSALDEGEAASLDLRQKYLHKAALVGNVALIRWLTDEARGELRVAPVTPAAPETSHDFDKCTFKAAVRSGHLELVKMLKENNPDRFKMRIYYLKVALELGYFSIVHWFMEQNIGLKQSAISEAETIRLVGANGRGFGHGILLKAAASGSLKWVKLFVEEQGLGFELDQEVRKKAVESGELELVKWLMGLAQAERTAKKGPTYRVDPAMKWLLEQEAKGEFAGVAKRLKELREEEAAKQAAKQGAEEDNELLKLAAELGHLSILKYFVMELKLDADVALKVATDPEVRKFLGEYLAQPEKSSSSSSSSSVSTLDTPGVGLMPTPRNTPGVNNGNPGPAVHQNADAASTMSFSSDSQSSVAKK